ncbi:hypothetical protein D3C87_1842970 [compost metagenome]
MRPHRAYRSDAPLHLSADKVLDHGGLATVRDVHHVQLVGVAHIGAHHVGVATNTKRAEADLALVLGGPGQKFFQIVCRYRRVDGHHALG